MTVPRAPFVARFRVGKFRVEAAGVAWSFNRLDHHFFNANLSLVCPTCSRALFAPQGCACGVGEARNDLLGQAGFAVDFNWGKLKENRLEVLLDVATMPPVIPRLDPLARSHIRMGTAAVLIAVSDMVADAGGAHGVVAHVEAMVENLRTDAQAMGLPW